jgi:hypothetical protein
MGLDISVVNEDKYVIDGINMMEFGLKSNPNDSRQNLYSVNEVVMESIGGKSSVMSQ